MEPAYAATLQHAWIDHVPAVWQEPPEGAHRRLAIWLPGLGGTKEGVAACLRDLAAAGFVAVAFDPWQHGERRLPAESQEAMAAPVVGNKRRHFWPMMALTAEEFPRVIDWAFARLGAATGPVAAGGISMGGDVALAAAALDRRITAVAAAIATPDWLRPGTDEPQGEPDTYAQQCYERCNPLTNLGRYAHRPAISFQCGREDRLVPPDGAQRFVAALAGAYKGCPERLEVVLHPAGHRFVPDMWRNGLAWLVRFCAQA